jgi:hypothetical protein
MARAKCAHFLNFLSALEAFFKEMLISASANGLASRLRPQKFGPQNSAPLNSPHNLTWKSLVQPTITNYRFLLAQKN